jgi:hypothetical protein
MNKMKTDIYDVQRHILRRYYLDHAAWLMIGEL